MMALLRSGSFTADISFWFMEPCSAALLFIPKCRVSDSFTPIFDKSSNTEQH